MDKTYKRKDISDTSVELEITIPADTFSSAYDTVLKDETKNANMDGFRKGAVPTEIVEPKLRDQILVKTFERIAPVYISQAVQTETLDMVAPPAYKTLPKMILGEDLVFVIVVTVMPKFKLGDLKKIKVEKKSDEVTDKEVEALVKQMEARQDIKAEKGSDKWAAEVGAKLGLKGIKTMKELNDEVKKALQAQKEAVVRRDMEADALNQGIQLSKISIPEPAVDYEAHEREHSFEHELGHRQLTMEQFLQQNSTTLEKMREMWKKDAKESIEADEFLTLYANEHGIEVTDADLEAEVKKIEMANPDADKSTFSNPDWRNYIKRVTLKQRAFTAFMEEVLPAQK